MVKFGWENDMLVIEYKEEKNGFSWDAFGVEAAKTLEANYMMEPNVTIKEFK